VKNIGKRRDGPELEVHLILRGTVAAKLLSAAIQRNCKPVDLLADVIETVCNDDLFDAVIDE
jgi:hypothetical protein